MLMLLSLLACSATPYDLVLSGGRVIDPESGLDDIRSIGIRDDRIIKISEQVLHGKVTIDASGLVVAPGFIDLHTHSPTPLGFRYQALDGVTTSLELEAGAYPISEFGQLLKQGSPLNYGASTGHAMIRVKAKSGKEYTNALDTRAGITFSSPEFSEPASQKELFEINRLLEDGLRQGGLGIGLLLDYLSEAVDARELRVVFEVAAKHDAPVFVHIRRGLSGETAGLIEVIELAKITGTAIHVCHLSHSAMKGIYEFLDIIQQARADGVDVSSEVLPYNAGTTTIAAAVFGRDWQSIFDITYEDIEWAATGERFNKSMWEEYREKHPSGMVIHHYLTEEWTQAAVAAEGIMVVTDGTPAITKSVLIPPQGVGSFSKVLGRYVREARILDLPTALAKMSLLPAQRLQKIAPVFARKGRLQQGADADITVFDPATIIDNATYLNPYQASTGVVHVLVNGKLIVQDGIFIEESKPGRLLTGRTR